MATTDHLLHQALELAPLQRARLAHALLDSLEAEDEIEAAWDGEIQRRREGARNGSAILIASEELFRSLDG